MMMQTPQNKWIWVALLVTLVLSWEALRHPVAEISQPTRSLSPAQTRILDTVKPVQKDQQLLPLTKRTAWDSHYNLFAPPPIAAPPVSEKTVEMKPPAPQAPPLPFTYVGRIKIGDNDGVLLNIDGEISPIQQGDNLLGELYQVQGIQAKQIQFLYKPLNQVQILNMP
jgi:hypothetical protein